MSSSPYDVVENVVYSILIWLYSEILLNLSHNSLRYSALALGSLGGYYNNFLFSVLLIFLTFSNTSYCN